MNTAPPNIASFRPPPSALPPNTQNHVGTHPNFNNPQQAVRSLGPPNNQTMNASQPRFMHGPGVQGPPLAGPPSTTPVNYSAINGQGMRPQLQTAGIGNIAMFYLLTFKSVV